MFSYHMLATSIFVLVSFAESQRLTPANTNNPFITLSALVDGWEERSHTAQVLHETFDNKDLLGLFQSQIINSSNAVDGKALECATAIVKFSEDVITRKVHALRMFDSWGKLGSGIATGNFHWLGRYYECIKIHTANYSGKYFVLSIGSNAEPAFDLGAQTMRLAICLPDSCSEQHVTELASPIASLLKTRISAHNVVQPTKYTPVDITALIITCILGFLIIVGTGYEIYLKSKLPADDEYSLVEEPERGGRKILSRIFTGLTDIVLSFSIIKNTKMIFDTTQKEGNINSLHGLRFLSMTWVILGHTFIFGASYVDNQFDAAEVYISKWSFQAVGNATFSVDTFFFLSGLLAAYLGLREIRKRGGEFNIMNILLSYAYRYLRLTPAYAFCILISASLYSKFGDGPAWPATAEGFRKPCVKYWWTNLLYINNLYPASLGDECFGWSWYLANDMQFFLILPFLLVVMYRYPKASALILTYPVLVSMITAGAVSSHYNQQPQALGIGYLFYQLVQFLNPQSTSVDATENASSEGLSYSPPPPPQPETSQFDIFWSDIYAKPWCRIGTYFVGVLTGLILYHTNTRVRMHKIVALVGWSAAFATGLALIYGLFGSINQGALLTVNVAAFYNAVSRPLWAYCLMWLVIACSSGLGGPINTFLSWKVFIPLSRLTYCAYLVHPLVIFWAYGVLEVPLHFSLPIISVLFAGLVPVSYAIAYCVSILVEMPMLGITKVLLGKSGSSQKITPVSIDYQRELQHHADTSDA